MTDQGSDVSERDKLHDRGDDEGLRQRARPVRAGQ
jgi:hypothetical protein